MTTAPPRIPDHAIDPIFPARWSPRAFDGSTMTEAELFPLLEAARWAPSAFNVQPWRFVYALRNTPEWDALFSALLPLNQGWVKDASALLFILSDKMMVPPGKTDPVPSQTASFDAGAAWAAFAHQATAAGLYTHAMAGFDHERAAEVLHNGDQFKIEAAIAVGRLGDASKLPEMLQQREFPSPRRPLVETVFHGAMPND